MASLLRFSLTQLLISQLNYMNVFKEYIYYFSLLEALASFVSEGSSVVSSSESDSIIPTAL